MGKVKVNTEFGELKEVVLGIPLGANDRIWDWTEGMDEEFSWMTPENFKTFKNNTGKLFSEVFPERYKKTIEQFAGFKKALEDNGVKVNLVPALSPGDRNYINKGVEQMYPRDVWCTVGDTVIASSLRMPWKRKQQFTMAPFYMEKVLKSDAKYISTPQASTDIISSNSHEVEKYSALLDGGDFMVNGKEVYIGQGHGSNKLGAKIAQDILGDEYKVYPLKLDKHALHLDCTISLIRPGLGIICRKWLKSDLPDGLKDWTWIEATEEEAFMLGVNGLPIAPNKIIFDSYHTRLISEMRKHGVDVIELPYEAVASWGGSFRCSTQPVYREDV